MGAMDARNMYSNLAVNEYLYTVASSWISSTYIYVESCLTVHLPHETKWNGHLMQLGNFIYVFLARHVSGTYAIIRSIRCWVAALVFCTEFLDGWWSWEPLRRSCLRMVHHPHRTHDLRSSSQDHHPSKNSVQKTIRCNSISNAPDDGLCTLNMSS